MYFIDDRTRLSLILAQLKQHRKFFFVLLARFLYADVTSVRTIADDSELNDTHFIWSNTKEPFIRLSHTKLPFFFLNFQSDATYL